MRTRDQQKHEQETSNSATVVDVAESVTNALRIMRKRDQSSGCGKEWQLVACWLRGNFKEQEIAAKKPTQKLSDISQI